MVARQAFKIIVTNTINPGIADMEQVDRTGFNNEYAQGREQGHVRAVLACTLTV